MCIICQPKNSNNVLLFVSAWMTIMRRLNAEAGSIFRVAMEQYLVGFGKLYDSFWMGLEHIYRITAAYPTAIQFDTVDEKFEQRSWKLDKFIVYRNSSDYLMKVNSHDEECKDS